MCWDLVITAFLEDLREVKIWSVVDRPSMELARKLGPRLVILMESELSIIKVLPFADKMYQVICAPNQPFKSLGWLRIILN